MIFRWRQLNNMLLILLSFSCGVYYILCGLVMLNPRPPEVLKFINVDFYTYYAGAVLFLEEENIYSGELTKQVLESQHLAYIDGYNYIYPPYLAVALALPTQYFGPHTISFLWYLINLVFLAVTIFVFITKFFPQTFTKYGWFRFYLFSFIFLPTTYSFYVGQINPIVLLLTLLAFIYANDGSERIAGVCLGIAVILKIAPIFLVVYLIVSKKFLTILYTALTISFVNAMGLILLPEQSIEFLNITLQNTMQPNPHPANQSLSAFFARAFTENIYSVPLVVSRTLSTLGNITVLAGIVGIYLFYLNKAKKLQSKITEILSLSLTLVVIVLISPLSWENFYILLVIPLLMFIHYWQYLTKVDKTLFIISIALMMVQRGWALYGSDPTSFPFLQPFTLLMSLAFYGLLIFYFLTIRMINGARFKNYGDGNLISNDSVGKDLM